MFMFYSGDHPDGWTTGTTAGENGGRNGQVPTGEANAAVNGGPGAVEDAYPQWQYDAANTATGDTAGPDGQPSLAWAWPEDPGESPLVWRFVAAGSTEFATRVAGGSLYLIAGRSLFSIDAATDETE